MLLDHTLPRFFSLFHCYFYLLYGRLERLEERSLRKVERSLRKIPRFRDSPETLQKLCLFTKFSLQKNRRNFVILCIGRCGIDKNLVGKHQLKINLKK